MDILENFEEISLSDSVLLKKGFNSASSLKEHFDSYLIDSNDSIAIFQFKEHLPDIGTVYQNLQIFYLLQEHAAGHLGRKLTTELEFRIISISERDWFVELCATLGGIGGLAAVVQLVYTIIHDKQIETTRQTPYSTSVPTGDGRMMMQTHYRQETVTIKELGKGEQYSIEMLAEYYSENLTLIEVYTKEGKLYRITIEQLKA